MTSQTCIWLVADDTTVEEIESIDSDILKDPSILQRDPPIFSQKATLKRVELPISAHLNDADKLCMIYDTAGKLENRNASEIAGQKIAGNALVLYASSGKSFTLSEWNVLHDAVYAARLEVRGEPDQEALKKAAKAFLDARAGDKTVKVEEDDGDDAWEDEDVEKPREKKAEESDEEEDGDEDEEEDEDSNASYEEESELESDDENDPRKKAILDTIRDIIAKDGKLDLEKLGLVEKNGKLVPRE